LSDQSEQSQRTSIVIEKLDSLPLLDVNDQKKLTTETPSTTTEEEEEDFYPDPDVDEGEQ
jgi:hypothetical protein